MDKSAPTQSEGTNPAAAPAREGSPGGASAAEVTVKCAANGPLLVAGPIKVLDVDGAQFDAPVRPNGMIALCRCGQSGTKPFCDGSHRTNSFPVMSGFQSAPKVPE